MANKGGVITRKDIIEDEALNWGPEYKKQVQTAIDSNKQWAQSILEIANNQKLIKNAPNQKEYITIMQQSNLETQKAINLIKQQEIAEISANKIKISSIAASEAERKAKQAVTDAENNLQKAKQAGEKPTSEEIVNQRILARNANNHALANSKLASEYEKLTLKARLAATALQNILIGGRQLGESTNQYNSRLQQAQREFDGLQARVVVANRAIGRFNDNVGNYPRQALTNIRELIGAFGVVGGISAFVSITKEAFNVVKDFENEIVNLAAIAGKSRDEISPLESEIRKVAKASINSATDVAKLATELVKLGSTPEEAAKLLAPINNLSIALKASAEDSATLVKSLLNSYGEGAEEAVRFTDVLAESANRSALDFEGLRDSFSYLAPTARALGISVERTASILGVLVDNGIKAESAGRLTSTAFARLAKNGLTLEDALSKINNAQKEGKTDLEVLSIATNLFGAEAGKIGLILANNTQKVDESTIAYQNSGGALQELTDKQLKSVNSELEILSSSWEDYILKTNDAAGGTKAITSILKLLSSNLELIINGVVFAGSVWLAYKASLILVRVQQSLMALTLNATAVAQAENTIATEVGGVAQLGNAAATTVATTAWQRFNLALKANALGLILAGLIVAIYYLDKMNVSLAETTSETFKNTDAFLKNREIVSKNASSINTLSDRYDVLTSKSKLNKEEQKELNKIIEILAKTVPGAVTEVNKYGDALSINTIKTREFVKANDELYKLETQKKLKDNIDLQKKLLSQKENLTISESDLNSKYVEGIGYVEKINGKLSIYGKIVGDNRDLTLEEQILFKKKVLDNEKNLAIVNQNIKTLSGLTVAEKQAAIAAEEILKLKEANAPRTIAIIDAEIKSQEDLILTLSDKSGKEGNLIKTRIKRLNDERDLIFNNNKAQNDDQDKISKKRLESLYELEKQRLEQSIKFNEEIASDELKNDEERINALENKLFKEEKLLKLNRDFQLNSEKLSKNDKLRINEDYDFKLKELNEKSKKEIDKINEFDLAKYQADIDAKVKAEETAMNNKVADEDNSFKAELDKINSNELSSLLEKQKLIEEATQKHGEELFIIKKNYALAIAKIQADNLQIELDAFKAQSDGSDKSNKTILDLENKLSEARKSLAEAGLDTFKKNEEGKVISTKEQTEKILEISQQLTSGLSDLANAFSNGKIQKIDEEIAKNDEYYANEIEKAGNDQRKKDILQKEADVKRKKLEEEKRKEQTKQARFNKVINIAEVTMATALAVIRALSAPPGLPFTAPDGILAGVLGALQLAAVIATPIPKYKDGRNGGIAELAIVGDGGVNEIIKRTSGAIEMTPAKDTLVKLNAGDQVFSSVDEYLRLQKASIMTSIDMQGRKVSDFQANQYFESNNKELVAEMKLTRKAIEKNKSNVIVNIPKIDLAHEFWKMKNNNWKS